MRRHAKASSAGSTSSRSRSRLLISLCLAVAALCAVCASPALAAQTHPYTGVSFGPDGVGGSASFENVGSIAVDPGSGEVYVYDTGAGSVYKFDSAGAPLNFSATGTNAISGVGSGGGGAEYAVAVAPAGSPAGTAGNIYVANNGNAVHVYSAAGTELVVLDQGGETCGVATDPSGNFYAGIYGQTINKYTPTANPPLTTDKVETGQIERGLCNVAADGLGNVYAANYAGNGLSKLEGLGDTSPTEIDLGGRTMGIAPGSNDLYTNHREEVVQYDSAGNLVGRFGGGELSESRGVAINSDASKIYVGNQTEVKVFGASTLVPDATTEAADGITRTTAVLHGTVGAAGGPDATCVFQYVTEGDYYSTGFAGASEKPCSPAGPFSGSGTTAVSATATGLSASTGYRFRVLATSSNGSNGGSALSFVTGGPVNVHTEPASNLSFSGATLNGTINPEGIELEECSFVYRPFVFGASYETVPCAESPASIGSGNSPVSVHLDLTGLESGIPYEFWLAAKNELGTSQGVSREFKTLGPSVTGAESVDGVSETSATFRATLNPNGVATTYLFEYVTQEAFEQSGYAGAVSVPAGGKGIGAGSSDVEVSAQADGLAPRTTYRFRVVATNSDGVTRGPGKSFATRAPASIFGPCPNDVYRTGPGANLPDCRAYERATPADKGGFDVEGFADLVGGASDGSGASFSSTGGSGMPAAGGGRQDVTTMFASRSGDSWSLQRLLPPETLGEKAEYLGSSGDMRYSLVEAGDQSKAALYLIDTSDRSVTEVVPYQTEESAQGAFRYDAISADGSRLFFESRAKLTAQAVAGSPNLYVWDRASGQVSLAGLLPASEGGGSPPSGSFGGAYWWTEEATYTGGATLGQYVDAIHAAASNGDQIYFTAAETGQLYLRRGLAGPSPSTVHVSAPEAGVTDPNGPLPAAFQEATPDGAHAFFISSEKLTDDASTGEFGGGKDLYRFDRDGGGIVDITGDQESSVNPNGARVRGLLGASADGSSGYFAARGKLTPEATVGANNIYRFAETGSGSFNLTYVAEAGGEKNWTATNYPGPYISDFLGKNSRVSTDGGVLVFTAGDNEIYMHRAATGKFTCISCDPAGAPSIGEAEMTASFLNSNNFIIPNTGPAPRLTRSLSADGNRVFFQTPDALLAADTNGSPKCEYLITRPARGLHLPKCMDTYEWEAVGTPGGSCTKVEFNGGCLYLLSTGKSEDASYFMDASSDGSDVFIATTSQLVPGDRDQLYDVYDVRVGGGLASQQFVPGAPCVGEACRTGMPAAPSSQTAGSASFRGPGNAKPNAKQKRCGKKHQKCAKKKKKKAHKKKQRHSKKKHNKNGHARPNKGDRK